MPQDPNLHQCSTKAARSLKLAAGKPASFVAMSVASGTGSWLFTKNFFATRFRSAVRRFL